MNSTILHALRREQAEYTPVWFMRQAGRSLPRYRELRADASMFDILQDPDRTAEITMLPLDYFPVDACVLYNDLSTPFLAAGLDVEMRAGVGPIVSPTVRTAADVERFEAFESRQDPWLGPTLDSIRLLTQRLDVPVLGFVGAPFTLCSYLIEGPRTRHLSQLKRFIWSEPDAWHRLADYWAKQLSAYAIAQHEAGAAAIQVFDSWAGALAPLDYESFVLPHARTMFERLADAGVPSINFYTGNPALLPLVAGAGGDCVSVDWRLPLDTAWELIGEDRAIQGNLDPVALLAGTDVAIRHTRDVLQRAAGRPGHIFNAGHGLLPETDPAVVHAVVDFVHEFTSQHA